MAEVRFQSDLTSFSTGLKKYQTPFGVYVDAIGVCEITTTSATEWNVIYRAGQHRSDTSGTIAVPAGAMIVSLGLRVPSGLVATNGNRLKVAPAVSTHNAGGPLFNADASRVYVATAVAASSTFAEGVTTFGYSIADDAASTARLSSAATLKLYNDNGSTAAGSGVTVASGTGLVIVRASWFEAFHVPTIEESSARPARAAT